MIPKNMKLLIYICSFILLIYAVSKVTTSNWAEVEHTSVKIDSLGGDGRDIAAFYKLNQLVEGNFLDRDYYEASARSTTSGGRWFANYNKKYQALFLGTIDGWSYFFYATPQQLKMIADRKIPAYKFKQFLKPFPQELLNEIPTRSRDWISVF